MASSQAASRLAAAAAGVAAVGTAGAFRASRVCLEGDARAVALQTKALPHLKKVWKTYSYEQGQRTQQLSPFEIDVLGPLFRNMGANLRHKVEDNFWDVAPPIAFYSALVYVVKQIRADILYHHRA